MASELDADNWEDDIWPEPVVGPDEKPVRQLSEELWAVMRADIDSEPDRLMELALKIADDSERMLALSLIAQHMVARFRDSEAIDILRNLRKSGFEPEMLIEAIVQFRLDNRDWDGALEVASEVITPFQRVRAFIQIAEFHSNQSNIELRDLGLKYVNGAIPDVTDDDERHHLLWQIEHRLAG